MHGVNVIVTGGRGFQGDESAETWLIEQVATIAPGVVYIGGGAGADWWAQCTIRRRLPRVTIKTVFADWKRYGRSAGPRRNADMAKVAGDFVLLAFPGGKGTAHMIGVAERIGAEVRRYNEGRVR